MDDGSLPQPQSLARQVRPKGLINYKMSKRYFLQNKFIQLFPLYYQKYPVLYKILLKSKMNWFNQQIQVTTMSQVVDQNFANNILFRNMSVLESLQQNVKQQKGHKYFGAYDIIDYSNRPKQVLKQQLRLSLYQIQFSYEEFNKDYKDGFALPKEYNMKKVLQRLRKFKQFFAQKSQADIQSMVVDFINILEKKKIKRFYETKMFQSEQSLGLAGNVRNMVKAGDITQKEQQKMKEYYKYNPGMKPEDLPFKKNQKYIQAQDQIENAEILIKNEQEKMQKQWSNFNKPKALPFQQNTEMDEQHREIQKQNKSKPKDIQKVYYWFWQQTCYYIGELKNNKIPHGMGKLLNKNWVIQGQFVNGYLHGKIKVQYTSSKKLFYQIWDYGKFIKECQQK